MELAEILAALRLRKLLVLVVVALAAGAAIAVERSGRTIPKGTATAQILVDAPGGALASLHQDIKPVTARAPAVAQVMGSAAVLPAIAHAAGISPSELTAEGPFAGPGQVLDVVTPSAARGVQLRAERKVYRLTFVARSQLPIITVAAQAPTPAAAAKLADSVVPGLASYVRSIRTPRAQPPQRIGFRQLGPALPSGVNAGSAKGLTGIAVVTVLIFGVLGILGIEGVRRRREPVRA